MHHRRSPPPPNMCDRTSRFWIYTTVISLLWGHFGIWTSPAGTRFSCFYCWILPMFTLLLLRPFFQLNIHEFLFVGHAFKWKTFFRLYFIVNLSFNTFFSPCHLILFCSNYLKTSHSQYILYIKIFGHFEISNKSLLSFSYQSSFKITYTWLVLHMYCILSITITCFSSCLFFWIKNVKGKDMLSQREYKILIMLSFRRFECVSMLYALNLWYAISIFELEKACFSWNGKFYSIFKGAKTTVIRKKLYNFFKILFWGLTRRIDIFGFISTLGAVYLRTWLIL